jgi:hypothetical protein
MPSIHALRTKRKRLAAQVADHLDFLVGSVSSKGLKYPAFNLTTKVAGKTVTRHVPRDLVPLVRRLAARHAKLKRLLLELAAVNWELVRQGQELRDDGSV